MAVQDLPVARHMLSLLHACKPHTTQQQQHASHKAMSLHSYTQITQPSPNLPQAPSLTSPPPSSGPSNDYLSLFQFLLYTPNISAYSMFHFNNTSSTTLLHPFHTISPPTTCPSQSQNTPHQAPAGCNTATNTTVRCFTPTNTA